MAIAKLLSFQRTSIEVLSSLHEYMNAMFYIDLHLDLCTIQRIFLRTDCCIKEEWKNKKHI